MHPVYPDTEVIQDDVLGELRCYPDMPADMPDQESLIGRVEWQDGRRLMFDIRCARIGRAAALAQARPRFPVIEAREPDYRRAAATELSVSWSEYCVASISVTDIIDRITLMDFSFHPDGRVELWYDAANLYRGCPRIVLSVDANLAYQKVELCEY